MNSSTQFRFGLFGLGVFLIVLLEILGIAWVASRIGAWWTLVVLLATTVLGLLLLRREWRRVWDSLVKALVDGQLPAGRMADATLVLLGGVLLVLPGFITDLVGLVLLLPFTRPFVRSGIAWAMARMVRSERTSGPTVIKGEASVVEPQGLGNAAEETIRGEVVDE